MSETKQAKVRNRRVKCDKLVSSSEWRCSITYKKASQYQQFSTEEEILAHFYGLVGNLHEAYSRELDEAGVEFRGALEILRKEKHEALEALNKTEV